MWQQFDADAGGGNETALAGDAEFVGVGRADVADGFEGVGHGGNGGTGGVWFGCWWGLGFRWPVGGAGHLKGLGCVFCWGLSFS